MNFFRKKELGHLLIIFSFNHLHFSNWFGLIKFCEEVNLQIVPAIDITNDVAELIDVIGQIKEYLDLFNDYKYSVF
jgi:hypothetical protein